jgi:hypothetical protein
MKPIITMRAEATRGPDGGTACFVTVLITHEGKTCKGTKEVQIPLPPSASSPYGWAQEALCALIDGLDCLCDVKVEHSTGCTEVGLYE